MITAIRALILTWALIGLLVAGAIGFYLGRITAPKAQGDPPPGSFQQTGSQQLGPQEGQPQASPLPTGRQKPPQGGPGQLSPGPNQQ